MKFFDKMFTQFFARAKPDSTQPKPRFMKNTNMPQIMTHTVSRPTISLSVAIFSSATDVGGAATSRASDTEGLSDVADVAATWAAAKSHMHVSNTPAAIIAGKHFPSIR